MLRNHSIISLFVVFAAFGAGVRAQQITVSCPEPLIISYANLPAEWVPGLSGYKRAALAEATVEAKPEGPLLACRYGLGASKNTGNELIFRQMPKNVACEVRGFNSFICMPQKPPPIKIPGKKSP